MNDIIKLENYNHISDVTKITADKLNKIASGELFPLKTSLSAEEKILGGFYPTDQVVIAGRTGMGKSSRVIAMIDDFTNWNLNNNWKDKILVLYDSFEMPNWKNMLRLTSRHVDSPVKQILKEFAEGIDKERRNIYSYIYKNYNTKPIYFSNTYQNVKQWEHSKQAICEKYPNHTVVNIVDHTRLILKNHENSEEALISGLMLAGMRIKNKHECINIFLSQMNRSIETSSGNRRDIGKNLPISSDIFGSDAVQQTADVVIALHRPGFYGLQQYELDGNIYNTGLTETTNDNLMIECILKNRDGEIRNLVIKHDIAVNKFLNYK